MSDDVDYDADIKKMTFTIMCKECGILNGYKIGHATKKCRGCGRVMKI